MKRKSAADRQAPGTMWLCPIPLCTKSNHPHPGTQILSQIPEGGVGKGSNAPHMPWVQISLECSSTMAWLTTQCTHHRLSHHMTHHRMTHHTMYQNHHTMHQNHHTVHQKDWASHSMLLTFAILIMWQGPGIVNQTFEIRTQSNSIHGTKLSLFPGCGQIPKLLLYPFHLS